MRRASTHSAGGTSFTALCCANDLLALGASARLAELGIAVPDDVSVAGFDDISVAAMTAPSLSTVRRPLRGGSACGFLHADTAASAASAPCADPAHDLLVLWRVHRGAAGAAAATPASHLPN